MLTPYQVSLWAQPLSNGPPDACLHAGVSKVPLSLQITRQVHRKYMGMLQSTRASSAHVHVFVPLLGEKNPWTSQGQAWKAVQAERALSKVGGASDGIHEKGASDDPRRSNPRTDRAHL